MVREHYQRLGFALLAEHDGATEWTLSLDGWTARPTFITSVPAVPADLQAA